jgi:hypothetical protein
LRCSPQVQTCFDRALDAKRKAEGTADPALKAELLEMEQRWEALAQSYKFTERLTDFTVAGSGWPQRFNRRATRQRPIDAPQKIIQDGSVDASDVTVHPASVALAALGAIGRRRPIRSQAG